MAHGHAQSRLGLRAVLRQRGRHPHRSLGYGCAAADARGVLRRAAIATAAIFHQSTRPITAPVIPATLAAAAATLTAALALALTATLATAVASTSTLAASTFTTAITTATVSTST